jgi:hypothetical protein
MLEVWLFLRRWTHSAPAAAGLNDEVITTIRIAPNPSDGIYTVSIEQTMPYAIRSLNGQTISSGMLKSGENTIVIADQPAGVYFLEVGNGVKKLVKL